MKVRVISALAALAIAIVILIFAHTWVLNIAIAGLAVGAVYELFKATGLVKYQTECCACFAFTSLCCLIGMVHRFGILDFLNVRLFGVMFAAAVLGLYLKHHDDYNYSVPLRDIQLRHADTHC